MGVGVRAYGCVGDGILVCRAAQHNFHWSPLTMMWVWALERRGCGRVAASVWVWSGVLGARVCGRLSDEGVSVCGFIFFLRIYHFFVIFSTFNVLKS